MTKNDPFAHVFPATPRFETPSAFVFDSDGDGVIDPWDCQPSNPGADSPRDAALKVALVRAVQARKAAQVARVNYRLAAGRRATVMNPVSRQF